jgi:hypothetical protein
METQQEIINFYKEEASKINGQFGFSKIAEWVSKAVEKYGEDEAMVALNTCINTFKKQTNK